MAIQPHDDRLARERFGLVLGALLIVLGLLFLAGQFLAVDRLLGPRFWEYAWPLFVIVPGLAFFVAMLAGGRSAGALAIPGSIITMVGLILLVQNSFKLWETWAYAWSLIGPTAVGIGLLLNGLWSDRTDLRQSGLRLIAIGLAIFVIGMAFFEGILNLSGFGATLAGRLVAPILLIGGGLLLLFRGRLRPVS